MTAAAEPENPATPTTVSAHVSEPSASSAVKLFAFLVLTAAGCAPTPPAQPDPVPDEPRPMPTVRVELVAGGDVIEGGIEGVPVEEAVRVQDGGERVTLTASGTDLRALLVALAEAAGVSLVVGPAVQGRVTAHLEDVPAREALERIIAETGYMIARPMAPPWGPTVYYVVPVNVNEADAATIQARFGVSAELAEFLVRARIPPE